MTEPDFRQLCQQTVESVLETMFFTAPLGESEGLEDPAALEARVVFDGAPPGVFSLRLSLAAAQMLAAGFLGADEASLTRAQTDQVVGEFANMLCGSLVSRMESDQSFELAVPEVFPAGTRGDMPGAPGARQSFELERGVLTIALEMGAA